MSFVELLELLSSLGLEIDRDQVKELADRFEDVVLVKDQRGYYDYVDPETGDYLHTDGFHIYSVQGVTYKVSFSKDSYSEGYFSGVQQVQHKTVTKEIWV